MQNCSGSDSPSILSSVDEKQAAASSDKQNYASSTYEESSAPSCSNKPTDGEEEDTLYAAKESSDLSDEEDMVFVPYEYQGDGRKREAKRHKRQTMVAKDEIEVDQLIRDYQNQYAKIIESEQELEHLKNLNISKKELQSKRNRLTAQLSRDRQKIEFRFLKTMAVNYLRLLKRLDKKVSEKSDFCSRCKDSLQSTVKHHKNNL